MKQRLSKLIKKLNNSMFDVAAAPTFIVIFGVPVLLVLIIAGLIFLAVKTIAKINREKKREDNDQ